LWGGSLIWACCTMRGLSWAVRVGASSFPPLARVRWMTSLQKEKAGAAGGKDPASDSKKTKGLSKKDKRRKGGGGEEEEEKGESRHQTLVHAGLAQLFPEAYVRPAKSRSEVARLRAAAAEFSGERRAALQRRHAHERGMAEARRRAFQALPKQLRAEARRKDTTMPPLTFLVPRHTPPMEKEPSKEERDWNARGLDVPSRKPEKDKGPRRGRQ